MPWSGGTFTRENGSTGWADDEAANIGIESGLHDTHDTDIATGINSCINKAGQNAATAALPMGGFNHTNVGLATARTHYTRADQVQDGGFVWLGSLAGAANAFTGTFNPAPAAIATGMLFGAIANHNVTGATTLNPNGIGAVAVKKFGGTTDLSPGDMINGGHYLFRKLASAYELVNPEGGGVQARDVSAATLTNSTTETTMFTTTIKGNVLGIHRGVRLVAYGREFNNNTALLELVTRIKFGSTTIYTNAPGALGADADNYIWRIELEIFNTGASNTQVSHGTMFYGAAVSGNVDGTVASSLRASSDVPPSGVGQHITCAEDTTADKTLVVTMQHNTATTNHITVMNVAYTLII